jgi:hypothetical protein
MVKKMFHTMDVRSDYWHPDAKLFKRAVQYDVFVPELSLAFEYNGEQHCILKISVESITI